MTNNLPIKNQYICNYHLLSLNQILYFIVAIKEKKKE